MVCLGSYLLQKDTNPESHKRSLPHGGLLRCTTHNGCCRKGPGFYHDPAAVLKQPHDDNYLGHELDPTTVANILKQHGLPPSGRRDAESNWEKFIESHWTTLAALDFTTVETIGVDGQLKTQYCLFVIHQNTREVHLAGITEHPTRDWMMQMARSLTDHFDGFLRNRTHVIMDRDGIFCPDFRRTVREAGCKPARTPPRSPNLNPHMERWFGSLKREVLSRVVPMGEANLLLLIKEYLIHYHRERSHQGLCNRIPFSLASDQHGQVARRARLGGVLNYYHRIAA